MFRVKCKLTTRAKLQPPPQAFTDLNERKVQVTGNEARGTFCALTCIMRETAGMCEVVAKHLDSDSVICHNLHFQNCSGVARPLTR